MLINKNYITERTAALMQEIPIPAPQKPSPLKKGAKLMLTILPHWSKTLLTKILFRPGKVVLAGIKCMRGQRTMHKMVEYNYSSIAADFVQYGMTHNFEFDTNRYFAPEEDDYIQRHIDDRIKCMLKCYASRPMTPAEAEYHNECQRIRHSISLRGNFFCLKYDGKRYYLPKNHFESGIWLYHYGLKSMPDAAKRYIAGKDFVDVGAFIGDSALVLLEYNPSQILAYEPMSENYQYMLKTISKNGAEGKIIPINKGLGDRPTTMNVSITDSASSMLDSFKAGMRQEEVVISTIDAECRNRNVGIIKMDIEGFEYFAVKGALETIRRCKPVLLLSIYHTGRDFFEIPPMLKDAVPDYKFKIVDTFPTAITEKILVGCCE